MNCGKHRKLYSAYLDGDLDSAKHRSFEEHLTECDRCAKDFAEFRKVVALAADLSPIQPSPDFDTFLRARLADSEGVSESGSLFGHRVAIAFGTICLLLVAFLGVHIYNNVGDKEHQPEDERLQLPMGREVVPIVSRYADERAFTNFVMPSVPVIGADSSALGEAAIVTPADWQEGRTFVLPIITNEQETQDEPEMNYVIRRISLISSSDETGL
jgi:hypothetical protein